MTVAPSIPSDVAEVLLREIKVAEEVELAGRHPGLLLRFVRCIDNTTGDRFQFQFSDEQIARWSERRFVHGQPYDCGLSLEELKARLHNRGSDDWTWHGDLIDWWLIHDVCCELKGRQLGVTWCDAGVNLWYGLYVRGSRTIIQSKNEDDAADYVDHVWEMWLSLARRQNPVTDEWEDYTHLRNGARILKPGRPDVRPHLDIEWEHSLGQGDVRVSMMNAMASTAGAGHGRTAARVTLDEFSRHPYAREAYKATLPTQGGSKKVTGKTNVISTGNGVSDEEGEGNFFHWVYTSAEENGVAALFLRWDMNADRDEEWYLTGTPSKLLPKDRGEQYPRTEREAFILTGSVYYDPEILDFYDKHRVREPLFRFTFVEDPEDHREARIEKRLDGIIRVFERPQAGRVYVIAADTAGGKGLDAHAACVIDLETGAPVCEMHSAIVDTAAWSKQLHFLGCWYNEALVAVESAGGWGEPVILFLRDGKDGRPPYPRLYRHRLEDRTDRPQSTIFGFPINQKTRPTVIENLGKWLHQKDLPYVSGPTLGELMTFVNHKEGKTSPAAQQGTHDDRVMTLALGLEIFRQRGHAPRGRTYHAKRGGKMSTQRKAA